MAKLPAYRGVYPWRFPLERTHCGMLLGNGTVGAVLWGGGSTLRITLGRADFWDHRGGLEFDGSMSFPAIKELLERGDEAALRSLFYREPAPGTPQRPSVIPVGRVDIGLGDWQLERGALDVRRGESRITAKRGAQSCVLLARVLMHAPMLLLEFPDALPVKIITARPSWDFVGEQLSSISFAPPEALRMAGLGGWLQRRPADPALCVAWKRAGSAMAVAVSYDEPAGAAAALDSCLAARPAETRRHRAWWSSYWKRVPAVTIPSETLGLIYTYGMYKLAGLTNPAGVAATLQGPWVEEYQMPPWSSDYHFNINVQECYWPVFAAGLPEHIEPLFDMVRSWLPKLRRNAKLFLGIDDGIMLPHAVDDRGTCMGGFWTGSIDHGSTAWLAHLMWLRYRYTQDAAFLRETAYPFLRGALRCYEEMIEWRDGIPALPVSVSPEYNGDRMNAWGRNASFQLANLHFLLRALRVACAELGEEYLERWARLEAALPLFATVGEPGKEEIALWEGMPLERSHRHHSHLAGIYPFDVIDPGDEHGVVARSIRNWIWKGMGEWSGWCMPWASIIHSRLGNGEAAELLLEIWERVFTNEGHGTLHDVAFPGISVMGRGPVVVDGRNREIMQIEAGMAAVTALQEMLVQNVQGVIRVMHGVPRRWKDVSFTGMHAEGAFVIDARREDGRTVEVRVTAEKGGKLRLDNPFAPGAVAVKRGKSRRAQASGDVLEVEMGMGETVVFSPG